MKEVHKTLSSRNMRAEGYFLSLIYYLYPRSTTQNQSAYLVRPDILPGSCAMVLWCMVVRLILNAMLKLNKPKLSPGLGLPRSRKMRALLSLFASVGQATLEVAEFYSDIVTYQRAILKHGWSYAQELKAIHKQRELTRRLYELRRHHYIVARRIGENMEYKLTDKGTRAVLLARLIEQSTEGKYTTIIIFDIPESERLVRRQLRLLLREAQFRMLQQSVWVKKGDILVAAKKVIVELGASKWVTVLRTEDLF